MLLLLCSSSCCRTRLCCRCELLGIAAALSLMPMLPVLLSLLVPSMLLLALLTATGIAIANAAAPTVVATIEPGAIMAKATGADAVACSRLQLMLLVAGVVVIVSTAAAAAAAAAAAEASSLRDHLVLVR